MKLATYRPAQLIFMGLATLTVLAGCTLAGSSGIGDVTPVGGDGAIVIDPNTPIPGPPTSPPDAAPTISELEQLSTQTAIDATAQAASGAQDSTTDDATDSSDSDSATPVPVIVTSDLGGEFVVPTNTPIGVLVDTGADAGTDIACPTTYTISAGDNLYRIALQFGLTSQELAAANGIINPAQLSVGTVLNIPGCGGSAAATTTADTGAVAPAVPSSATAYTVQTGDNLFRISLQFNMTWTVLAAFNGLSNPNAIYPGQVIQIP